MSFRFLASFAVLGLGTGTAHAYCRTHTLDGNASSCEVCPAIGLPIAWPRREMEYAFNQNGFPGLTDAELRRIIAQSVATWEDVECEGESVGIEVTASDVTTTLGAGPEEAEPNTNVIVHYSGEQWKAQSLPDKALAITLAWFRERDGAIIGADIMFNGGMGTYGECSPGGCVAGEPRNDLQNVATHEFGHFLGLAHSPVPESTMLCGAQPGEVVKRSLETDDIAGLCEIYPPASMTDGALTEGDTKSGGGCQLTDTGASSFLPLLLLLWRRRRGG